MNQVSTRKKNAWKLSAKSLFLYYSFRLLFFFTVHNKCDSKSTMLNLSSALLFIGPDGMWILAWKLDVLRGPSVPHCLFASLDEQHCWTLALDVISHWCCRIMQNEHNFNENRPLTLKQLNHSCKGSCKNDSLSFQNSLKKSWCTIC